MLNGWYVYGGRRTFDTETFPREYAKLRAMAAVRDRYIWDIAAGKRPTKMKEDETILYNYATEMYRDKAISDATFAAAVKAFGEKGLIDLVATMGYYDTVAMTLITASPPVSGSGTAALTVNASPPVKSRPPSMGPSSVAAPLARLML